MAESPRTESIHYETPATSHLELGLHVLGFGAIRGKTELLGRRVLDCYAAVFVHTGSGWFETPLTGRIAIGPGTLFWLFPGLAHGYGPDPLGWSEQWVMFDGTVARAYERLGFLSLRRPVIHVADSREFAAQFAQMQADFAADRPLSGLLSAALVHRLIVLSVLGRDEAGRDQNASPFDARQVMAHLEESGQGALDLRAFAREHGMGYSTLRRRFKEATGYSPKEYVLRCRLRHAKSLLAGTAASISDVGKAAGFEDPYYFSRLFRAKEGLSPTAFRAQQTLSTGTTVRSARPGPRGLCS